MSLVYIIGAGLSGATLARLLAEKGYQVHVYEMQKYVGGNCYDYFNKHGILVQKYGPHIFHTDKKYVYEFVKRFAKFIPNPVKVSVDINGTLTDMPINFKAVDCFAKDDALIIKQFIKAN
jgi:UDP-galactopyranose mutase